MRSLGPTRGRRLPGEPRRPRCGGHRQGVNGGAGTTRVRGLGGSRRPRISSSVKMEVNSDDVADGIVTEDPVTPHNTGRGHPSDRELYRRAHRPCHFPRWACEDDVARPSGREAEQRACRGRPGGREPGTCAGGTAGIEVKATGPCGSRILEKLGDGVGLNFAREGLLRGSVGFGIDAAARGDGGTECDLSGSETAPLVDIQGSSKSGQMEEQRSRQAEKLPM